MPHTRLPCRLEDGLGSTVGGGKYVMPADTEPTVTGALANINGF